MIDFKVEITGADSMLSEIAGIRQQLPYATAIAINRTAEEVLAEGRKEILENFDVRVPFFDLPPVQLPAVWRATKDRPIATVALGDNEGVNTIGARRVAIFSKFELGGTKDASNPDFPIAIPTSAIRPSPADLVPRSLYPVNLGLAPRKDASGATIGGKRRGKVRGLGVTGIVIHSRKQRAELGLEGLGGTFTMIGSDGKPLGVFQRTGPGLRGYRMIWAYRQSIRIPKRMDFELRGTEIIEDRFEINFWGALDLALATAK